jgi:hypothetical protein
MNSDQFVSALIEHVHSPAIQDTIEQLERPTGRKALRRVADAAAWYATLSEPDRASLKLALELAVHRAVFGLLCTLDGVRAVHDDADHEFQLSSVERGLATRLNSPAGEPLHDKYQGLIFTRVFG